MHVRVTHLTFGSRLLVHVRRMALYAAWMLAGWPLLAAGAEAGPGVAQPNFGSLRAAIADLNSTFGPSYPGGREFLARLDALETGARAGATTDARAFERLKQEALLANPLLQFNQLLLVKRRVHAGPENRPFPENSREYGHALGLPSNHECNSSLPRAGYDNEITLLSPVRPDGLLRTLYRPDDSGYVGEVDLHWQADRFLFTKSDAANWKVWELPTDGSGLRQVSQMPPDVDCFDACYLPNGQIVFGSTASFQAVPCWHGQKWVSNLYRMNADGSGARQLCFDQDHDLHPVVLPNGQVLYSRWDYTGINHIYLRQLMVMNPDGTGQRAVYGSSSWYPNALYFPRPVGGESTRLVSILSGYHGVHRMGQLVLLDTARGWQEAEGIVHRISGRGDPVNPIVRDNLVDQDWPKFLHPVALSEKHFLVSARLNPKADWGLYLADVFDNLVLVREEPGFALIEPVPLKKSTPPPVIPDRVDLARPDGVVYLHDIHSGLGLKGVPRGVVKGLRVFAYHFGYRGLAGPDKIGLGGPWEVMRILGTVPLEADGSAHFRVPANTPLAVQALDAEGKAVQLMRSWFTVMPGETASCVGCHERPTDVPPAQLALAARRDPRPLLPWRGPARGFDFAREVQPVLDRHCVSCHDGQEKYLLDLRAESLRPDYQGRRVSQMEIDRLHPQMREDTRGVLKFTPAYEALLPYLRRVGIEDDVSLLVPGEYHADTSPLVHMLRKGHRGVALDPEAWDRLVTWIDLNAPCHGTWAEVYPVPDGVRERRAYLRKQCGAGGEDPEVVPVSETPSVLPKTTGLRQAPASGARDNAAPGLTAQPPSGERDVKSLDLGDGVTIKLVRVPAGEFVMGDEAGEPDERPLARVAIRQAFWLAACEVSNEQYCRFDASHDSRYYGKRHARSDDQGLPLDEPQQPVVRVSWQDAMRFCRWLSERTGLRVTLPTEAQWEYACRAGSGAALSFGSISPDFSPWANLGDQSFSRGLVKDGKQITGGLEHLVLEGAALSDIRFNDQAVVTTPVGRYQPNVWGLHDLHGNAAEWTLSTYRPYPYREDDGRNSPEPAGRKVVRGGSFFDHPRRARSAFRLDYPAWQRLFNVGFRIAVEEAGPP